MNRPPLGPVAFAAVLSGAVLPAQAQLLPLYECSAGTTSVNFGAYSPFSASALDGVGEVRVDCSLLGLLGILVSYKISISAGSSGAFSGRQMVGGGYRLNYNLYTDPARNNVWGNGAGGSTTVNVSYLAAVLFTTRSYSIYGRIPPRQNLPTGTYTDTIVVTVDY